MPKYLDLTGLTTFKQKNDQTYVAKETGKGLSTNDYTTAEKNKLSGIDTGAQVNVIETIKLNGTTQTVTNKTVNLNVSGGGGDVNVIETVKVNGTALTPDADKAVNVSVPTQTSQLTNNSGFVTITLSTTDIGEGATLAANTLYGVYE